MHYAFAPCYVNLSKGAGVEYDVEGENLLGLHGNAILSSYPIRNVRSIPLKNGKDKMAGREKRLGQQTAIVADVALPGKTLVAVSVHLDAQSSQPHRRDQMRDVLDGLRGESSGGDRRRLEHHHLQLLKGVSTPSWASGCAFSWASTT